MNKLKNNINKGQNNKTLQIVNEFKQFLFSVYSSCKQHGHRKLSPRRTTLTDEPSAGSCHIGPILQISRRHSAALPWGETGCRHSTPHHLLPAENCLSELSGRSTMGQAVEEGLPFLMIQIFSKRFVLMNEVRVLLFLK